MPAPGKFSSLSFVLEASSGASPSSKIIQRIELYNYSAGRWEIVDERNPSKNDLEARVTIATNPARFVNPATGQVRARIGWFDRGSISPGWTASIDRSIWEVSR